MLTSPEGLCIEEHLTPDRPLPHLPGAPVSQPAHVQHLSRVHQRLWNRPLPFTSTRHSKIIQAVLAVCFGPLCLSLPGRCMRSNKVSEGVDRPLRSCQARAECLQMVQHARSALGR